MGISSCLEPQHPRLAIPDTPPELASPRFSSLLSKASDDRSWKPALPALPLSPPMSNYDPPSKGDMASVKASDEPQTRPDPLPSLPRTQLPSLSSLFGPPPPRPLHSPLSDRPSSYASTSPLDRPRGSSSTGLERSYSSSSYFPPTSSSSVSQPRSAFEPRLDDRSSIRALTRSFPGPLSPRIRETDQQRPNSRSDYGSGGKWSLLQETVRSEYAVSSRETHIFRTSHDRLPPALAGQKHERDLGPGGVGFAEHRRGQSSGQHHSLPPTPSSTVTSEGLPAKDALGPRIWTGTHFLPRFVRAAEVPGEGLCYFYDDGSHCKTIIDGEAVNAHWGVTKAGKPRKRLAIACVTCREKKIKCDPDFPRCVQCDKFGRICKFKNAPRGGHNSSPLASPAELDDPRRLGGMIRPPPPDQMRRPGSNSSDSVSPRTTVRRASPEHDVVPAKRMRIGYDHFTPITPMAAGRRSPPPMSRHSQDGMARPALSWHQPELPRIHEDILCRTWQTDPYVSDPKSVTSTVSSFFVHTDAAALRLLPEMAFKTWLQNSAHTHTKSPEDLMLVYSILAAGVALSGGSRTLAGEYAQVARYAAGRACMSLQLVQARLLLSLYFLSVSRPIEANEMSSAAMWAAMCLELNLELDQSKDAKLTAFPCGLTRAGYAESRRRTFWSCFILERVNGLFPTPVSLINPGDIFIRLPSDLRSFEEQEDVSGPVYESTHSSILSQGENNHQHKVMTHLIPIVTTLGDAMTNIYRVAHRTASPSRTNHSDFAAFQRTSTLASLDDWRASLPQQLDFSAANLNAIPPEERGALILMHCAYHVASIKLRRHVHQRDAPEAQRHRFAQAARGHATQLLSLLGKVASETRLGTVRTPPPFAGAALIEAVDVLSAGGNAAEIPALVEDVARARPVLGVLGEAWEETKALGRVVDARMDLLALVQERGNQGVNTVPGVRVFLREEEVPDENGDDADAGTSGTGGQNLCWQVLEPLDRRFPRDMDSVYHWGLDASPLSP